MLGGAVGSALRLLVGRTVDVGAFALVGMTAFYRGLANAPIGAIVLVCQLTGTTPLLVPSILTSGLTFVLQRGVDLYPDRQRRELGSACPGEP